MIVNDAAPLEELSPGLFATPTSRLPYQANVMLRSYVLRRPAGNIVIYNSPGISESARAITALGKPVRLLINHGHEAMYGHPSIDLPVWVNARDSAEVGQSMRIDGVITRRESLDDDFEMIPTPGHTAGTTSYLWDNGAHRFLFTGDFIWIEDGQWKAVVLDARLRDEYLESLRMVRELDFDVLVPWGTTEGGPSIAQVAGQSEVRDRIDAIISRVAAGGNR